MVKAPGSNSKAVARPRISFVFGCEPPRAKHSKKHNVFAPEHWFQKRPPNRGLLIHINRKLSRGGGRQKGLKSGPFLPIFFNLQCRLIHGGGPRSFFLVSHCSACRLCLCALITLIMCWTCEKFILGTRDTVWKFLFTSHSSWMESFLMLTTSYYFLICSKAS